MAGRALQVLYILWALAVGASVSVQLLATVVINRRSSSPTYHAVYISSLGVLLGGIILLPQSFASSAPWKRPKRCWSTLGGMCSLPAFCCIPAGAMLGIQLVLLCQLFAMLSTALVFDFRKGDIQRSDSLRLAGFGAVLVGVVTDNISAVSSGTKFSPVAIALLAATFASGVGYALQAKCNSRLALDVGATPRAILISAAVNVGASLPMGAGVYWGLEVPLTLDLQDWPLWLWCGFQSAFYTCSLAILPGKLGYTTSYLTLLVGKLISSSVLDALGVTGKVVLFDWLRALSLLLVFVGTAFFSGVASSRPLQQRCDGADGADGADGGDVDSEAQPPSSCTAEESEGAPLAALPCSSRTVREAGGLNIGRQPV